MRPTIETQLIAVYTTIGWPWSVQKFPFAITKFIDDSVKCDGNAASWQILDEPGNDLVGKRCNTNSFNDDAILQ